MSNSKPSPHLRSPWLLLCLLLTIITVTPTRLPSQEPPAQVPPAQTQLEDAIVATVNEAPILVSDVERAIALGLAQPTADEDATAFRQRVLQELIDDRLRLQEVERFGFEELPLAAIETEFERIRGRFDSGEAFRRHLRQLDLDEDALRQLVTRQLLVLIYVEERLGPRVFVDADDIRTYYRSVLTPQLEAAGAEVPQLNDVRGQIREVLRQQRLNEEIRDWTQELRLGAAVQTFQDRLQAIAVDEIELPPLVERFSEPE